MKRLLLFIAIISSLLSQSNSIKHSFRSLARGVVAHATGFCLSFVPLSVTTSLYARAVALDNTFVAEKGLFQFQYPKDYELSPKPLKTHQVEVLLKAKAIKGSNVGVTVDPVKIQSIEEFTTAAGLAEKVLNTERAKEGVFEATLISASETSVPIIADGSTRLAYDIEYKIDSSRGLNHFNVRATVKDKKLFVFTAQCKEDNYVELKDTTADILKSLTLG